MNRVPRIAIPALAALTLLNACGRSTTTAEPAATPTPAAVTPCANADLGVTVTVEEEDSTFALMSVLNKSTGTCAVAGWLTVTLLTAGKQATKVGSTRVDEPGPSTEVVLRAGEAASAGLRWTACVKADEGCGVGNIVRYDVGLSGAGRTAELAGFPTSKKNNIAWKELQIGTLQPAGVTIGAW
ncbi:MULTISPECIES: DUF4232 domain-containing protein [Actinoplanes]|uniref:DUF4232 domain-containing protein n=1 Tax=Actinoplanes TaxID=1865 RepID=UPI0005F2F76A|nr:MULTISPECIES: DUF4232 domain-containing protein [Actinoplanes]GLY01152.1 hypothetical protein Acsp01_15310 [Actinoplanes sp. NBRC 101535]